MSHVYGNYTTEGLFHRLKLRSAYSAIGELPFTNYTPGFKGVIDYIWYSANALNVTNLLGPVDEDYINKQVVGFPNAHFPSDHLRASAGWRGPALTRAQPSWRRSVWPRSERSLYAGTVFSCTRCIALSCPLLSSHVVQIMVQHLRRPPGA